MAKVICTLKNASHLISGVKFEPHPDKLHAVVSEEIDDAAAAAFCEINGYELVGKKTAKAKPSAATAAQPTADPFADPKKQDGDAGDKSPPVDTEKTSE